MIPVEVSPSPQEARRLVAGVVTFWLSAALLNLMGETVDLWALPVFIVAFVAGLTFYWTLFSIGGRETGRSPWWYFAPRMPRFRGPDNRDGWNILLKLVNPRWWIRVIGKTGWPPALPAVALIGSLTLVLAAVLTGGFGTR